MHLKRSRIPRTWPLPRKGTKYLIRPAYNLKNGIPLLIVLRDILKVVKTRKEVKRILNLKKVKVNGKIVRDESLPLSLFDNLSLENQNFKIVLKNKKFGVEESKETGEKIIKVIGKKMLKKGVLQINLSDGRNYLTREKVNIGDSVLADLKENKIKKILEFKKGCKILFISGKHISKIGIVEEIDEEKKRIIIKFENEKINSRLEDLIVIK